MLMMKRAGMNLVARPCAVMSDGAVELDDEISVEILQFRSQLCRLSIGVVADDFIALGVDLHPAFERAQTRAVVVAPVVQPGIQVYALHDDARVRALGKGDLDQRASARCRNQGFEGLPFLRVERDGVLVRCGMLVAVAIGQRASFGQGEDALALLRHDAHVAIVAHPHRGLMRCHDAHQASVVVDVGHGAHAVFTRLWHHLGHGVWRSHKWRCAALALDGGAYEWVHVVGERPGLCAQ